jgi:hypothetical protein
MEVVKRMGLVPTDNEDKPEQDLFIKQTSLIK